ncbi:hypothetical protein Gbem_3224 [Citrifermentans bemidjiense Bem]|uniref:Uncharacterized protein n=1 Tax=Citrifermentans bemidjiense (strain ATCC BAA-1014 / DSM 16622 / JCM 12645 / Bem) TaxID=404380 RepID=B5E9P9_CITBB|nr:hypothetical protein Gbem_3224 [Citrifermentans bemidjiense Bem]
MLKNAVTISFVYGVFYFGHTLVCAWVDFVLVFYHIPNDW